MRPVTFEHGGRLDLVGQLELQDAARLLSLQCRGQQRAGRLYRRWRASLERVLLAAEARLLQKSAGLEGAAAAAAAALTAASTAATAATPDCLAAPDG